MKKQEDEVIDIFKQSGALLEGHFLHGRACTVHISFNVLKYANLWISDAIS